MSILRLWKINLHHIHQAPSKHQIHQSSMVLRCGRLSLYYCSDRFIVQKTLNIAWSRDWDSIDHCTGRSRGCI